MTRPSVYSDEFLLWGIRDAWCSAIGSPLEISLDTTFTELLDECIEDDFRYFELRLETLIGVSLNLEEEWPYLPGMSDAEWREDVGRRFTIRHLISYLQSKAPDLSFAPLNLPGATGCEAAGCFLGLQDLVQRIHPKSPAIAPSTPVSGVLRGHRLRRLWEQLRWHSRGEIAIPVDPQCTLGWWLVAGGVFCGIFAIIWEILQPGVGWFFLFAMWGWKFLGISRWLTERSLPLPKGIETFGDLARYVARSAPQA